MCRSERLEVGGLAFPVINYSTVCVIPSVAIFYIGLSHFWISAARTPFVRYSLLEFG